MAGAGGFAGRAGDAAKNKAGDAVKAQAGDTREQVTGTGPQGDAPKGPPPGTKALGGSDDQPKMKPGAGGTSMTPDKDVDDDDSKTPGGGKAAKAATAGAAAAAPVALHLAFQMMLLAWLKTLMAMAVALAKNIMNIILAIIIGVAKSVVAAVAAAGAAVAGFFGGVFSAATGAVVVAVTTVAVVAGGGAVATQAIQNSDLPRHDGLPEDCKVQADQALALAYLAMSEEQAGAQSLANAKTIYGVFSAWGMNDTNVAGVLGNWYAESRIDPTGVETIYDEPFTIGPRKQAAAAADFLIDKYAPAYGAKFPNINRGGIGLGQWTDTMGEAPGGRNTMLREYAKKTNQPWHTLPTQLGFMISADDPYRVTLMKSMVANTNDGSGSVEGAVGFFMGKWEGLPLGEGSYSLRVQKASEMYAQMSGWQKDQSLADSILAQAGTSLSSAAIAGVNDQMDKCVGARGANVANSDLAVAATSYAWPFREDSRQNDGTYIYVWLHKQIFPGDSYFASCDRSVATGVRWSGTDDTYPPGAVQGQLGYVSTSPKWTQVTDWGGDFNKLLPGDVFLRYDGGVSHTVVYVGPDAPLQVWGAGGFEPGGTAVEGSLSSTSNGRSPGIIKTYDQLKTYTVWRSTGKEPASKFTSLVPPASMVPGTGDKSSYTTPSA